LEIFQGAHQFAICTWHAHPCIYDDITELCRQSEIIQNYENANVPNIGEDKPRHRKYKRLKLGGHQAYYPSSD
jgi:hypothetical protein